MFYRYCSVSGWSYVIYCHRSARHLEKKKKKKSNSTEKCFLLKSIYKDSEQTRHINTTHAFDSKKDQPDTCLATLLFIMTARKRTLWNKHWEKMLQWDKKKKMVGIMMTFFLNNRRLYFKLFWTINDNKMI